MVGERCMYFAGDQLPDYTGDKLPESTGDKLPESTGYTFGLYWGVAPLGCLDSAGEQSYISVEDRSPAWGKKELRWG